MLKTTTVMAALLASALGGATVFAQSDQDVATAAGNAPAAAGPAAVPSAAAQSNGQSAQAANMAGTATLAEARDTLDKLDGMLGKDVYDKNGHVIGQVTGVDHELTMAEVMTPEGMIAMAPEALTDVNGDLVANEVTANDVLASNGAPDVIVVIGP